MKSFFIYFYYRLSCYYNNQGRFQNNLNAYFTFCFIILIHLMSIQFLIDSFIFKGAISSNYFLQSVFTRRFIIAPSIASPIFLFVYLYYVINRKVINEKMKIFSKESQKEKDKGKKKVLIYFIFTFLFFVFSLLTGGIFN